MVHLFQKKLRVKFPEFLNFIKHNTENRPSEMAQKSIFYLFSIIYIKLENSFEKEAFMFEIVP